MPVFFLDKKLDKSKGLGTLADKSKWFACGQLQSEDIMKKVAPVNKLNTIRIPLDGLGYNINKETNTLELTTTESKFDQISQQIDSFRQRSSKLKKSNYLEVNARNVYRVYNSHEKILVESPQYQKVIVYNMKKMLVEGAKYKEVEIFNIKNMARNFKSNAKIIEDFIMSAQGREIMANVGYNLPEGVRVKLKRQRTLTASNGVARNLLIKAQHEQNDIGGKEKLSVFQKQLTKIILEDRDADSNKSKFAWNELTEVQPEQKDTDSSKKNAQDKFIWYELDFDIGSMKVTIEWSCWGQDGNAYYAARNGASTVSEFLYQIKEEIARNLGITMAKTQEKANSKPHE